MLLEDLLTLILAKFQLSQPALMLLCGKALTILCIPRISCSNKMKRCMLHSSKEFRSRYSHSCSTCLLLAETLLTAIRLYNQCYTVRSASKSVLLYRVKLIVSCLMPSTSHIFCIMMGSCHMIQSHMALITHAGSTSRPCR